MKDKSHLTALPRKKLSQPAKYLSDFGLIRGKVLDFGCGRGYDADKLDAVKYDPHYFPLLIGHDYDVIYCNYVLNVIPDEDDRAFVLLQILQLLAPNGVAYITVRTDKKKLRGYTKRGTWQGLVVMDLPIEKKTAHWTMYRLTKNKS